MNERRHAESSPSGSRGKPSEREARSRRTKRGGSVRSVGVGSAGSSDINVAGRRGAPEDPSPLAGNALSSAYDNVPMPTASIEFHHSMAGDHDDFFYSLETQIPEPAMGTADAANFARTSPAVAPAVRDSRSSSVACVTTTASAPVASSSASERSMAPNPEGIGREAQGMVTPASDATPNSVARETTSSNQAEGSGAACIEAAAVAKEKETDGDLPVPGVESKGEASSSLSVSSPPPPPSPPPLSPSLPQEQPAPVSEATEGVEHGVDPSSVPSSISSVRGPPIAEASERPVPTLRDIAEGKEETPDGPTASATATATAAGREEEAANAAKDAAACVAPREDCRAADDGVASLQPKIGGGKDTVHVDGGQDETTAPRGGQRAEVGLTEDGRGDSGAEREAEGGDSEPIREGQEEEGGGGKKQKGNQEEAGGEGQEGADGKKTDEATKVVRQRKSPARKRRKSASPWYQVGTVVVITCSPDDKVGSPRPFVATRDLFGRPVR